MLINLSVSPSGGDVAETFTGTSVSHTSAGVTYNFDSTVTYGFYVNGEPFVVSGGSDVVITSISPAGVNDAGRDKNGTVVQPRDDIGTNFAAFDSELSGYDGTNNEDPGKTGGNLTISAATWPGGASVVKAVSRATKSSRSWIDKYSVLTVVPSTPSVADPFRPPIAGTDKTSYYSLSDMDMTKLKSITPVAGQAVVTDFPDTDVVFVSWRETTISSWRDMQPAAYHTEYGNSQKTRVSNMFVALHGTETVAAKTPLARTLVQAGIDYCGAVSSYGMKLAAGSAHNDEYKLVEVFAAVMLGSPTALTTPASDQTKSPETSDVYEIASGDIGSDYLYVNANNFIPGKGSEYNTTHLGMAEWRFDDLRPNPSVDANYRGLYWNSNVIMCITLEMLGSTGEARAIWNWEPTFDYAYRSAKMFEVDVKPGQDKFNGIGTTSLAFWAANSPTYGANHGDALVPEAPISLTLAANGSELDVTVGGFRLPGSSPITQTDIRYSTDRTNWTTVTNFGNSGTTSGLSANTYYYVQARYVNAVGNGPWTNNAFFNNNGTLEAAFGLDKKSSAYRDKLDAILALDPGEETNAATYVTGIATTAS